MSPREYSKPLRVGTHFDPLRTLVLRRRLLSRWPPALGSNFPKKLAEHGRIAEDRQCVAWLGHVHAPLQTGVWQWSPL